MRKRILICGGAGFLGFHLCKKLLKDGHEIICLDDLSSGSVSDVQLLSEKKNFIWIQHDITKPIDLEVDEIYNLACPASPKFYRNNPIKTLKTSVYGSLNMLEIARRYNAKVLLASTSEVYGEPETHPQNESYKGSVNPIGPRACYDEGKRCAETAFMDYYRQYGTSIKIVRIFNTYGPNMRRDDGRVISNFIVQALKNKPLTIYGRGHQTRSFCYVYDLIDALIKMMETPSHVTGPINIGNPLESKIIDIARDIINLCDSKSTISFHELPVDDPTKRLPDIYLAEEVLNWNPKIDLKEGLKRTIDYFSQLESS